MLLLFVARVDVAVICCQSKDDVICCQNEDDVIMFDSGMGDLRFWDPRFTESVRVHHTNTRGFTAVDVHPRADVIALSLIHI